MSSENISWDNLPSNINNCDGCVVVAEDRRGIIQLEGAQPCFCFFRAEVTNYPGNVNKWMPPGTYVQVNARKEDPDSMVPYMATRVWFQSDCKDNIDPTSNMGRVDSDVRALFSSASKELLGQIPEEYMEQVLSSVKKGDQNSTKSIGNHDQNAANARFYDHSLQGQESLWRRRDDRSSQDRGLENRYGNNDDRRSDSHSRPDERQRGSNSREQSGYRRSSQDENRHGSMMSHRRSSRDDEGRRNDRPKSRHDHDRNRHRSEDERRSNSRNDDYRDRKSYHRSDSKTSHKYSRDSRSKDQDDRSDHASHSSKSRHGSASSSRQHHDKPRNNDQGSSSPAQSSRPKSGGMDYYSYKESQNFNPWRDQMAQMALGVGANDQGGQKDSEKMKPNDTPKPNETSSGGNSPEYQISDDETNAEADSQHEEPARPKRPRTPLQDDTDGMVDKPIKRRRYKSPEIDNLGPKVIAKYPTVPSHKGWKAVLPEELEANKFHEVTRGDDGMAVVVSKWISQYSGVLSCPRNGHTIVFNINQVIEKLHRGQWSPAREIYSTAEIKFKLSPGTKLRCFYRKFDSGSHQYQATVVWREGSAPKGFRTKEYLSDLDKVGANIKENRPTSTSLFSKVREGVIHEYISFETGLIRLIDEDQCVAVFALDQVWARSRDGDSDFLLNTDTQSLMSYLPIGTLVKVTVRSIPHNHYSQLKYQAVLLWTPDLGSSLPSQFVHKTSTRQARLEMSMFLDEVHDRIKQQLGLGPLSVKEPLYPVIVPVSLNLLPKDGSAQVVEAKVTDPKHMGLVRVKITQFNDPTRQICLYAIFHIEDVYDTSGRRLIQVNSEVNVMDLKDADVDLICRSVAKGESYSDIKSLFDRIEADKEYEISNVPLLQATAVFLRDSRDKDVITGAAPLPTFFRLEPSNLNRRQCCTSFYFNIKLKLELDNKVHEFIDLSNNVARNYMKKYFHPRFFDNKEIVTFRCQAPKHVLNRLGSVDIHRDIRHDFGTFNPWNIETGESSSLPGKLNNVSATLKVLWFDRPSPKYGLVKVDPIEGGSSVYAFFSRRAVNTNRFVTNISDVLWRNMKYLMVNAELVDATSKIPYVVTEMWVIGDKKTGFTVQTDAKADWKKVVPAMLADQFTFNFRAYLQEEKKMNKLIEMEEKAAKIRMPDEQQVPAPEQPEPVVQPAPQEEQTTWLTNIQSFVCKVERVLGANYALASGFQTFVGNESKRFFALFDLCDVTIDGQPAAKTIKSLKDILEPGTKVRMNAVHYATENSWNLCYIATAVVAGNKTPVSDDDLPPSLPSDAPCLESSSGLKSEKIENFKIVSGKVIKKPAPALPEMPTKAAAPPPQVVTKSNSDKVSSNSSTKEHQKSNSYQRSKDHHQRRGENNSDRRGVEQHRSLAAIDSKNAERRHEIIKNKPELYAELRLMEINRGGSFFYDCKACGIQGMPIDDAEDHLGSSEHKENKAKRAMQTSKYASKPNSGKQRYEDRSEAEVALFLNSNKGITVETKDGVKTFSCDDCQALKMSFDSAKKHVLSQAHKKKDKNRLDNAALEAESKDMRLVTRTGNICYFCQPCAFRSDSVIEMKKHLIEQSHKRLTVLFCHVCKEFQRDRTQLSDHRFSIRHKKKLKELEEDCENPSKKKKDHAPPKKPKESKSKVDKPATSAKDSDTPDVNKDGEYNCKYCNFTTKDKYEEIKHEETASHKRRLFLHTQQMPSGGIDAFKLPGERCNTIEEMCLIREAKDIEEKAAREKSIRTSQEIKDAQERLLNKMFDSGILTQLEKKTTVRCNTCKTILNGKEKQLTRQLLAHLVGDKHRDKLRVQIKAEENTGVDRNTAQRIEEEEERAAAAEAEEEEDQQQPPEEKIPVPDASAAVEEIVAYLKKQNDVLSLLSDQLFACSECRTGLMHPRALFSHITSSSHEDKITPSREWRQYVDLIDAYEHGNDLFKCLPCDSGVMHRTELELHLAMTEHLHRNVDEEKDKKIEKILPIKLPTCDQCEVCLMSDLDVKTHERYKHRKDSDLTADQIENMKSLSQSRNLDLEPSMMSVRGRVLQLLPMANVGILQLPRPDNQFINVLFDISRVEMPDKKRSLIDSVEVGYPVLVNCVQMEPTVAGYSANINYYASAVTLVDEDEHSAMPVSFTSLQSEIGGTITEAQKLSKDTLTVQLDLHAKGNPTPLFHTYPDMMENEACLVVLKNQSCVLFKSLEKGVYAIQILESVLITEDSYETSTETFEVGNVVITNCILVDPSLPSQYLVTGCWNTSPRDPVPREMVSLSAIDMYQSLARSYCMHPEAITLLDLSSVLVPEQFGAIGFDDIAADRDDDIAADNDDIAADNNDLAANGDDIADVGKRGQEEDNQPMGFKKIKLGF